MDIILTPTSPRGEIQAISSKSAAHRILICAAFADSETVIRCDRTNKDIDATAACLCSLGAKIEYRAPFFKVTPIKTPLTCQMDCGESGSTLRFLLPVVCALGVDAQIFMHGRLPSRPLSPLYGELVRHGARLSPEGSSPLSVSGRLGGGEYKIRGDVSSQFISGLLFALCVSGLGGSIIIEGKTQSAPYIDMTLDALSLFGVYPKRTADGYLIPVGCKLCSPKTLHVEGDWSNAAFMLCMGALGENEVKICGLNSDSKQGDREIVDILRDFGADIKEENGEYTVKGGKPLHGTRINAEQIPDLVPVISVVAACAEGRTHIYGAERLRLKESDRIATTSNMLRALGASVEETDDGLLIDGRGTLTGGCVDSANDHRIAMSAAVASVRCQGALTLKGAECVSKSYPDFWEDISTRLGIYSRT